MATAERVVVKTANRVAQSFDSILVAFTSVLSEPEVLITLALAVAAVYTKSSTSASASLVTLLLNKMDALFPKLKDFWDVLKGEELKIICGLIMLPAIMSAPKTWAKSLTFGVGAYLVLMPASLCDFRIAGLASATLRALAKAQDKYGRYLILALVVGFMIYRVEAQPSDKVVGVLPSLTSGSGSDVPSYSLSDLLGGTPAGWQDKIRASDDAKAKQCINDLSTDANCPKVINEALRKLSTKESPKVSNNAFTTHSSTIASTTPKTEPAIIGNSSPVNLSRNGSTSRSANGRTNSTGG